MPLYYPIWVVTDRVRRYGKAVDRARQAPKDIGQEYSDGFEPQNVSQCNMTVKAVYGFPDGNGVAANISHVSYEGLHHPTTDIALNTLVERAEILNIGQGIVDRIE